MKRTRFVSIPLWGLRVIKAFGIDGIPLMAQLFFRLAPYRAGGETLAISGGPALEARSGGQGRHGRGRHRPLVRTLRELRLRAPGVSERRGTKGSPGLPAAPHEFLRQAR